MKPLISYFGGKQRMVSKIIQLLPPHTVYVEPFAGGASLLFAKPRAKVTNSHHYREVINDLDRNLITLYRVAQTNPDALEREILATLHSRNDYYKACEIYNNPEGYSELTIAWATYVAFMQAFANVVNTGWQTGIKGRNLAATWNGRKKDIHKQMQRLENVHIENRDALDVIRTWDGLGVLHYCDPPYVGTLQPYKGKYTQDDLDALIEVIESSQGSFILSGYDNANVPSSWQCYKFAARATASNGKLRRDNPQAAERIECVWVVDRSDNLPEDLSKIATHYGRRTQTNLFSNSE